MTEKLHKVLARAGLGSRREAERWIAQGRVEVDGRPAKVGDRVQPRARIRLDGRPLSIGRSTRSATRVLIYHKPAGEICSRKDPAGRASVFDRLPKLRGQRWIAVGRLDLDTSGLLLFTNDGELAACLMHPSSGLEREYLVRVQGRVSDTSWQRLTRGVMLDGQTARFLRLDRQRGGEGSNTWYRVVLSEGRNREVRRLWQAVGARVSRLKRVRFGPLHLPRNLPQGRWQELDAVGIRALRSSLRSGSVEGPAR